MHRKDAPGMEPGPLFLATIVLVALGMNVIGRGVVETFAVFLLPVQEAFAASRSEISGVYALTIMVSGFSGMVIGQIFDRLGARATYLVGLVALGAAFVLAGYTTALWQYYLAIGVLAGFGVTGLGMVPATALLSRWFSRRLGTVMGLAYGGLGIGMLLAAPLTQIMLESHDWRTVYRLLGWGVLALILVVLVLPLGRISAGSPDWQVRRKANDEGQRPWRVGSAVRTSAFWGLFGVYFFTSVASFAVMPHTVAYLVEQGYNPRLAATIFGLAGVLSIVGNMNMGWLSDRFGRRPMVTISYACTIVGILFLMAITWLAAPFLVYPFVLFFGLNQGARGPIITTMTAMIFPGGGIGRIYGTISMGMGLGAGVGTWGSGLLHDLTGSYTASFVFGIIAAFIGMSFFYVIRALAEERA